MSKLKEIGIVIGGTVLAVLGLGMWQSPEINWYGFLGAWASIGNEIARLADDPFAILGIVVLVIGVLIAILGLRRLVRG